MLGFGAQPHQAFHGAKSQLGLGAVAIGLALAGAFLFEPDQSSAVFQFLAQPWIQGCEVTHVVRRVVERGLRQRPF